MPRYEITAPDGQRYEITAPDGASQEEVLAYARQQFGKRKEPAPKRSWTDEGAGALANATSQVPFYDEAAGAFDTAINLFSGKEKLDAGAAMDVIRKNPGRGLYAIGDIAKASGLARAYDRSMADIRAREADFNTRRPNTAALMRGSGIAATAALPAGKTANLFTEAPRAVNAARGAVTAGLTAAGYAAADRGTPAERLKSASEAAMNPVVLGMGAAGGALAPARAKAQRSAKLPVKGAEDRLPELKAGKTAAYNAVDNSGARYRPEEINGLLDSIQEKTTKLNIDKELHPTATRIIDRMQANRGKDMTLTELDNLRKYVQENVGASNNRAERLYGRAIVDEIDRFISDGKPFKMLSGDADEASRLINAAREANARYRKVEAVTGAVDKARRQAAKTGSGGNINNAVRQNLDRVAQKTRNLTPEEAAMMEEIIVGGRGQNILRQIGKLSPQGNGLMLAGHLAASGMTGGASTVVAGVGAASKIAADRHTQRKVAQLINLMADGPTAQARGQALREFQALAAKDPAVAQLQRQLAARLSKAAGIAGRPQSAPQAAENLFARP